jgi:hypothetical protein
LLIFFSEKRILSLNQVKQEAPRKKNALSGDNKYYLKITYSSGNVTQTPYISNYLFKGKYGFECILLDCYCNDPSFITIDLKELKLFQKKHFILYYYVSNAIQRFHVL